MKTVSKGKLKARMLAYFREVEETGEPLIVTDRGRQTLEVRAIGGAPRTSAEVLRRYRSGPQKGRELAETDLLEPLPEEEWEILSDRDNAPW